MNSNSNDKKKSLAAAPAPITELQMMMAEKAVNTLRTLGAQFRVIYGEADWGELQVVKTKTSSRKRNLIVNPGVSSYAAEYLKKLQKAGDVIVVPVGPYQAKGLQSALTARAGTLFGRGSVTSHIKNDQSAVEAMLLVDPSVSDSNKTP